MQNVAIFWDYGAVLSASGYTLVHSIRAAAQTYGMIKSLRAYTAVAEQFSTPKAAVTRSELQCSGVSLVDCPHNGRKDVADKMMIVDMLAHALDNSPTSTVIFLISGDRDFAYALSILRLRCYPIILCAPNNAHGSLLVQASDRIEWETIALPVSDGYMNARNPSNEEPHRNTLHGYTPSTPRFRGNVDSSPPLPDIGIINNPYLRHLPRNSGSFSSDSKTNAAPSWRPSPNHNNRPPAERAAYNSRHNSFNSTHSSDQGGVRGGVTAPTFSSSPPFKPEALPGKPTGQDRSGLLSGLRGVSDSLTSRMEAVPPAMDETSKVSSTPEGRAATTTASTEPLPSAGSPKTAQTTYQLPTITPLVVNQSPSTESSPSLPISPELVVSIPDAMDTSSENATPVAPDASVPSIVNSNSQEEPERAHSPLFTLSESGAAESVTSTSSAYVTAASQSAPSSPAPTLAQTPARLTPPAHYKALVRILQAHRSKGILKPLRSAVALQVGHPSNGNPYKQLGVERWAQYADLARKAGIIELGGREAAAWVALTPAWYGADAA